MDVLDAMVSVSDRLYLLFNGLSGRSLLLDALIALPIDNDLVKGGPIGACFIYAWFAGASDSEMRRKRSILILTLLAAPLVLAITKTMGDNIVSPRPLVRSQAVWLLEDGRLAPSKRLEYRRPLLGDTRARDDALQRGDVQPNDLVSFPSDHSAFFTILSAGIALACLPAGLVAVLWSVVAIMASRIITGMHSPLDIAIGALIGLIVLLPVQVLGRRFARGVLDKATGLTIRHQALAAAMVFLAVFEVANALRNLQDLAGSASEVAHHYRGK